MIGLVLILGLIQGIAEFLPVSSSAHLLIAGHLVDLESIFEFSVLLNFGSLAALVWYLRRELLDVCRRAGRGDWRLLGQLAVSALPAGILGLLLVDLLREPHLLLTIGLLLGVGALMLLKTPPAKVSRLDKLPWPKVLAVAHLQALALLPGTSRSGVTILGGLWLGFKRDLAVKWSFLMAIPLIAGALLRVLLSESGQDFLRDNLVPVVLANLLAFGVGLAAIGFLMRILRTYSLRPFGVYRLVLGSGLLLLFFLGQLGV